MSTATNAWVTGDQKGNDVVTLLVASALRIKDAWSFAPFAALFLIGGLLGLTRLRIVTTGTTRWPWRPRWY